MTDVSLGHNLMVHPDMRPPGSVEAYPLQGLLRKALANALGSPVVQLLGAGS